MSTILEALRRAQLNRPGDEGGDVADSSAMAAPDRPSDDPTPASGPTESLETLVGFDGPPTLAVERGRKGAGVLAAAGVALAGLALGAAGARFVSGTWNPFGAGDGAGDQVAVVQDGGSAIAPTDEPETSRDAAAVAAAAAPDPAASKTKRARDSRKKGPPATPQGGEVAAPGPPSEADKDSSALGHGDGAPAPAAGAVPVAPPSPLPTDVATPGAVSGEIAGAVAGSAPAAVPSPAVVAGVPGMPPNLGPGLTRVPGGAVPANPPVALGAAAFQNPPTAASAGAFPVAALPPDATVGTQSSGEPSAGQVLETPPTDAPEVSLLFIKWSRDLARRVASLRGPGGKLMLVHEGDIIEGMRVASIRPDAVELQWRGTNFLLLAAR